MPEVYFLYHMDEPEDGSSPSHKLIGLYTTPEFARQAISRKRDLPGFRDHPERWQIVPKTVDEDDWTEGFDPKTNEKIVTRS